MIVPILIIVFGLILIGVYAIVTVCFSDNRNIAGLTILTYARIPIFFIGAVFGHWAKDGCHISLSKTHKALCLIAAIIAVVFLAYAMEYLPEYMWTCSLFFIPFIVITPVLSIALALFFEKFRKCEKVFAAIGIISLEIYICHVFSFDLLFDRLTVNIGKIYACLLVLVITAVTAYLLYYINKKYLQRLFQ